MEVRWQDQHERMKRWRERVKEPMRKGEGRDAYNLRVLDELAAFFTSCYHLRDWLINSSSCPVPQQEVDDLINQAEPLKLCRDVCNGSKHAVLRGGRVTPNVEGGSVSAMFGPLGIEGSWFEVATPTREYDALQLVDQCLHEWDKFLKARGFL